MLEASKSLNKIIELLTIIGFEYDRYNDFYFFKDRGYIIAFSKYNGIRIIKDNRYLYDNNVASLKEDFVLEFLNKEFIDIIRKHKIKKLL